jgi:hypothetical protein
MCVFGYQVWEKSLEISVKHSCQQNQGGFCQNNKYLKYEVYVICMVLRTMNFSLENFSHLTINLQIEKELEILKFFGVNSTKKMLKYLENLPKS